MPQVKACTVRTQNEGERTFQGYLLGFGSSQMASHIHQPSQPPAPGMRCSGCRWTETRIYKSTGADCCYVVEVIGRTTVDGEQNRYRAWWAQDAAILVTILEQDPPPRRKRGFEGEKELPAANRRALDQAADTDNDVWNALADWEEKQENLLDAFTGQV